MGVKRYLPTSYEVIPVHPKPQSVVDIQEAMVRHVRRALETVNWPLVPGIDKKATEIDQNKINDWLANHLVGQGLEHAEFRKRLDSFLEALDTP